MSGWGRSPLAKVCGRPHSVLCRLTSSDRFTYLTADWRRGSRPMDRLLFTRIAVSDPAPLAAARCLLSRQPDRPACAGRIMVRTCKSEILKTCGSAAPGAPPDSAFQVRSRGRGGAGAVGCNQGRRREATGGGGGGGPSRPQAASGRTPGGRGMATPIGGDAGAPAGRFAARLSGPRVSRPGRPFRVQFGVRRRNSLIRLQKPKNSLRFPHRGSVFVRSPVPNARAEKKDVTNLELGCGK